jgi:hypothetical protein
VGIEMMNEMLFAATLTGPSPDEFWRVGGIILGIVIGVVTVVKSWMWFDTRWLRVRDYERDRDHSEKIILSDGARSQKVMERIEKLIELYEKRNNLDEKSDKHSSHRG